LRDIILVRSPPAEAAAEMDFIDVALRLRKAGGFAASGKGSLAILCRAPDLTAIGSPDRSSVHGLHRRVVLERVAVDRLHLFCRARDRRLRVTILIAHGCPLSRQPSLQELCE